MSDTTSPIEIYSFIFDGGAYYQTSGLESVVYNSRQYDPVPLRRSTLEANITEERTELKLQTVRDNPVAELFRVAPPSSTVSVSLYRGDGAAFTLAWTGRILSCEWSGLEAVLFCEPVSTSLERSGLRRAYSRGCPHVLYGPSCRVSTGIHKVSTTATGTGTQIQVGSVGGQSDGYFDGGYLDYRHGSGIYDRRMILSQVGTTLTISYPIQDLAGEVDIFPGCDHTTGANGCGKFSNLQNFGGFPFVPSKNPFGGNPIF